jgi:hypothetical protein
MELKREAKIIIEELQITMTNDEIRELMNRFSTGFLLVEKGQDLEKTAKFGRRAHY